MLPAALIRSILVCFAFVPAAHALKPTNVTDGELALMPPYCVDVQGFKYGASANNRSPRALYWISRMGEEFWALHHYCWGLINLHRAQNIGLTKPQGRFLVQSAINDYHFVIQNARPTFPLLPEIYTRVGEAQLILRQHDAARQAFDKARSIKPDYWPPYVRWADALVSLKLDAQARSLIAEGLAIMPTEPALLEKARQLGVKPPAAASQAPPASASAPAASAPTPSAEPAETPAAPASGAASS